MREEIHLFRRNFWHGCQNSFLRVGAIFLRKTYTLKNLYRINFFRSFWWTSLNSVPKIFGAGYQEFFLHFFLFSDIEHRISVFSKNSSAIYSKQHSMCPEDKFKRNFGFEKLIFFIIFRAWAGSFPGFVERSFASFSQVRCWWLNQQLEEKVFFPETFSDQCHTLSKNTAAFLKNLLGMTAKSAVYMPNGFVEHLKENTFSEKVHLWTSSGKNWAFAERFPAWVPNL